MYLVWQNMYISFRLCTLMKVVLLLKTMVFSFFGQSGRCCPFLWIFFRGTLWDTFWRLPVSGVIGGGRVLSVVQSAAVMDFAFLQLKSLHQARTEIWNLPPESFVMSVGATNEPEAVKCDGFLPFLLLSACSLKRLTRPPRCQKPDTSHNTFSLLLKRPD